MPAPLLHVGATVQCSHAGQATPVTPNPRVLVSGQATVAISSPYAVAGCSIPSCTAAQWLTGTTRVMSGGQPLVFMAGSSTCPPTNTPLVPLVAQSRVLGT
jgi:hypothetical protein